jgi:hypothetical protein
MNYFRENYDPDGADAMKASYEEGEDVEVATASRLHALSTSFAKKSIDAMRSTENQLRSESCVDTYLLTRFANMQRGWGQSVMSRELHAEKVLWGCL